MKVVIDTNIMLDIALNRQPFVADILDTFRLADIDESGFREALDSGMNDFEDAVQYVICRRNGCDALATRNKADYGSRPNIFDPAELIELIKNMKA